MPKHASKIMTVDKNHMNPMYVYVSLCQRSFIMPNTFDAYSDKNWFWIFHKTKQKVKTHTMKTVECKIWYVKLYTHCAWAQRSHVYRIMWHGLLRCERCIFIIFWFIFNPSVFMGILFDVLRQMLVDQNSVNFSVGIHVQYIFHWYWAVSGVFL